MKWRTICNAAPRRLEHIHTGPQSRCLCGPAPLPLASYSSCPRQLSPATIGPPFHLQLDYEDTLPPRLASRVLGQTWTLFIFQSSVSLQGLFHLTSLLLSYSPSLIMWLLHSSNCVSLDLNKTLETSLRTWNFRHIPIWEEPRMLDAFFPLRKRTGFCLI
jgi:hypothetical protein